MSYKNKFIDIKICFNKKILNEKKRKRISFEYKNEEKKICTNEIEDLVYLKYIPKNVEI